MAKASLHPSNRPRNEIMASVVGVSQCSLSMLLRRGSGLNQALVRGFSTHADKPVSIVGWDDADIM